MKPIRVLQVLTVMNRGGAETMVMNHYRKIDRNRIQFDFMVNREERGAFDDEIEEMGGRIYRLCPIRPWTYLKYFNQLDEFFKEHASDYMAVHSHIQENSGFVFKYAKRYGLINCIANSHIDFKGIDAKVVFRKFASYFLHRYSTRNIACGYAAGKYLFGKQQYEVFPNAIDVDMFVYSTDIRNSVRQELGIENRLVIGSVARLCWQKNHTFMLDVMAELIKPYPEALLLLVGTGDKDEEIRAKVKALNLKDNVWFLGSRSDVNELLQAIDVFFMPSLFEGLPVSVIEAQAAGLHCVLSDTIDRTTDVTGNIQFVSLDAPLREWVSAIVSASMMPRENTSEAIAKAGYDVNENVKKLVGYYTERIDMDSLDSEEQPLVTVGISAYNEEMYIMDAVKSVLAQTYSNFELIITDDASTDRTAELLKSINDDRVVMMLENENKGLAYRLNQQIDMARGRYFVRMDADDMMFLDRIEKQVEYLRSFPSVDVCGTPVIVIDKGDNILGVRGGREKNIKSLLHPTVMGKTEWFRRYRYNEEFSGLEDFDLWLRARKDSSMRNMDKPLLFYRDMSRYELNTVMKRRKLGLKVVWQDRHFYDNPVKPFFVIVKDAVLIPLVWLVHYLHLDSFFIRKRNIELSAEDLVEYTEKICSTKQRQINFNC